MDVLVYISGFSMEGCHTVNSKFVARLAHDLRAPIRHLTEFSRIFSDSLESPTEQQSRYLGFIENSAKRCNDMIGGLVRLARVLESLPEPDYIDARDLATAIFDRCAAVYNIEATLDLEVDSDGLIRLDPGHASELMDVLFDNAFKFRSSDRPLHVTLQIGSKGGELLMRFSDNGIGFEESYIPDSTRVFSQFSNKSDGEGIGLALASAIVGVYAGRLEIGSPAGATSVGSSVLILLPLAECDLGEPEQIVNQS